MRRAALALLCGVIGGGIHLLPVIGSETSEIAAWESYAALAGTMAFLTAAFTVWAQCRTPLAALGAGFLIGFGYFATSLHWLGESAVPDPSIYTLNAALTALGAWIVIFPWWALAFLAADVLTRGLHLAKWSLTGATVFVLSFSVCDVLLGDLAFRIPLSPLAAMLLDTLWEPLVAVIGQHGASTAMIALAALTALVLRSPTSKVYTPALVGVFCLCTLPTALPTSAASQSTVTSGRVYLAQPNPPSVYRMGLAGETDPNARIMESIFRAIERGRGADLIVFPETAIPYDLATEPDRVRDLAAALEPGSVLIAGFRRPVATPAPDGTFRVNVFNTAYAITAEGTVIAQYDKAHLVPFGEYMPQIFYDLGFNVVSGTTITPGRSLDTFSLPGFAPFSLLICYEGLLSGPVSRETEGATWLLNISSEGLFGETIGPRLLLHTVRLRSLETGLPMLRSASTGFTGVIDGTGTVLTALPLGTEGGVMATIPHAITTPFRFLGYWPLYALWALAFLAITATRLTAPRSRYSSTSC